MDGHYEKCDSYGYDCDVQWVTDDVKRIYMHINTNNKLKHEMKTNENDEKEEDGDDDDDGEQRMKERKVRNTKTDGKKESGQASKRTNNNHSPSASQKNLGLVK